jgi:hypothetical protein
MATEDIQRLYDDMSSSSTLATVTHGTPPCPACTDGVLRLWEIAMSFDPDSTNPPQPPQWHYYAVVMVCRDQDTGCPGCGFSLPVQAAAPARWPAPVDGAGHGAVHGEWRGQR